MIRPERNAISGKFGLAQAVAAVSTLPHIAEKMQGRGLPLSVAAIEKLIVERDDGLGKILGAMRDFSAVPGVAATEAPALPTVVLLIDQAEELLNAEGRDEAQRFIGIITRTLAANAHFMALVSIRSDSFHHFQLDPRLAECAKEIFTLDMMMPASFRSVIEGPAAVVRPRLKIDPELTDALLKDIAGQDALPLLAFTLAHLHDRHRIGNGLALAGYSAAGGRQGMIDEAVKLALSEGMARGELPRDRQAQLVLLRRAFIPHLASVSAAGQLVRRIGLRSDIPVDALPLVDCLVRARLLISDGRLVDGQEHQVVEVAHEALLREWPDLNRELQSEIAFLRSLERLKGDERSWSMAEDKDKSDHLLTGSKLDEAERWRKTQGVLPASMDMFIGASTKHRRRRQMALASLGLYVATPYVFDWAWRFASDVMDYVSSGEPFSGHEILVASTIGFASWFTLAAGLVYLPFALRRIFR